MAVGEDFMNEVELGTYSEQEAVWKFGDGLTLQGAKVKRIICGMDAMKVRATVKKATASGRIQFPENAPETTRNIGNNKDFNYVAQLL